jgi:hypothetical protein
VRIIVSLRSWLGLLGTAALCLGAVSGCGSSKKTEPADAAAPLCTADGPGPAPLRRLTRFEIGRSLADVMGLDPALVVDLPFDEESQGYDNGSSAYSVSALHASKLLDLGEKAAAAFILDAPRVSGLANCDPTGGDPACQRSFIQALGAKLWRRPLEDGEIADLVALQTASGASDGKAGVTAVIAALLQSPAFIYRPEIPGPPGAPSPLPASALATRLAYLVTSSAPDDQLLSAAADGRLATAQGLLDQTERLMTTQRAVESFQHFVIEWWELEALAAVEKDTNLFRTWTDDLPAAFLQETNLFLADAWQNGPTLEHLFTGTTTFADANLAAFYGYPVPAQPGFQPIALDPTRASGLFTQGAFLATHAKADQTSPVLRGKFVRARLLCDPPPPPPPDIVITPPTVDPRLSTRERFQQHTSDQFCLGCHRLMDPIGFTFEHFDATGRWRDDDGGKPVDASGSLTESDIDGDVDGLGQLTAKLLQSGQVRTCVATQWFRWAFGRSEQTSDDLCTIGQLSGALAASGGDMRSLVRATVKSPTFLLIPPGASP